MKTWIITTAVLSLAFCAGAQAKSTAHADKTKACAAEWNAEKAAKNTGGVSFNSFYKTCMTTAVSTSTTTTTAPTSAPPPSTPVTTATHHATTSVSSTTTAPAGTTAVCKDGSTSKSTHHSGTCWHHGGVAKWM